MKMFKGRSMEYWSVKFRDKGGPPHAISAMMFFIFETTIEGVEFVPKWEQMVPPMTDDEFLELMGTYQDYGPEYDGQEGDHRDYLDAWYNFSAIGRAISKR